MLDIATLESLLVGQPAILAMVFGSVFLAALGIWMIVSDRQEMRRRLAGQTDNAVRANVTVRRARPLTGFSRLAERIGRPLFERSNTDDISELRMRLIQAGFLNPRAMAVYFGARIVLALAFPTAVILLGPAVAPSTPPTAFALLGLTACAIGFFVPVFYVSRRIRKRQEAIRHSFPDAMDMLLVCVESGLGLDSAISRVGQEMGPAHPELAEHLHWLSHELRIGRDRDAALRGLAERTGVDDVSALVTLLLQTSQLGTSMADALRSHAFEMRATRMLRAEEKAHKMPVKLSAIVVFLILPALFLFIMSPAILTIALEVLPRMSGQITIDDATAQQQSPNLQ